MSTLQYTCLNCGRLMKGTSVVCECQTPIHIKIQCVNTTGSSFSELLIAQKERDDALMIAGVYRTKSLELLTRIKRLEEFVNRFLDPEDLGWAIGKYDRDCAREALGKERVESKAKETKP